MKTAIRITSLLLSLILTAGLLSCTKDPQTLTRPEH